MDLSDFLPKRMAKKLQKDAEKYKEIEKEKDDDPLRSFLPASFGKSKTKKEEQDFSAIKREDVKPPEKEAEVKKEDLPTFFQAADEAGSESSDSPSEDDDLAIVRSLPISHEAKLKSHNKLVSCLTLDRSGSRLVSGSYDYTAKMWDFSGMDSSMRPFRSFEPEEGHHIKDIHYSHSGDQLLVITGGSKAKLFTREGSEIEAYAKGDPYIRDMRNTDGHVAALTCGEWHPTDRECFLTASQDNSIRLWKVGSPRKHQAVISVNSKVRGGRSPVTAATFSYDGRWIAGASQDGSISLWPAKGPYIRPTGSVVNAHTSGTETSSLSFSKNSNHFVSRGGDDTVKLWDVRNFKTGPVLQASNLPNLNSETNVIFSPDERLIVTGTGVPKRGDEYGHLAFLDRTSLEVLRTVNVTTSSAIRVIWHAGLNQLAVGNGDGSVHMLFDPILSLRGAKLCASRQPRQKHADEMQSHIGPIITPQDPQVRPNSKRQREKLRRDPILSRRPEPPVNGPGRGGKVGTNYTNHIMKQIVKDTTRDEDPRDALLKYAKIASDSPQFVNHAYKKNQPNPVFDERLDDEDEHREVVRRP